MPPRCLLRRPLGTPPPHHQLRPNAALHGPLHRHQRPYAVGLATSAHTPSGAAFEPKWRGAREEAAPRARGGQ